MAAVFNPEQKLEALKIEIIRIFDELYDCLAERRKILLSRLAKMKEGYDRNLELEKAIKQLRITKNQSYDTLTSNLVGESLDTVKQTLDIDIELKMAEMVPVHKLKFMEFRCYSEKLRKSIKEIDFFELIPEYVNRENPYLKACKRGHRNGEIYNPRGITLDKAKNEVYVCVKSNRCIQVLTSEGVYLRSIRNEHLIEPFGVCLSPQEELFVTERSKESILKFTLEGQLLNKTGSRGNTAGRFAVIAGLCYDAGLLYVCDSCVGRIQVFNSNLNFIKEFGYGEIEYPTDVKVYLNQIYILTQDTNSLFCYNRHCTLQKKIKLSGLEQNIIGTFFFVIDTKGNFLISDNSTEKIFIFSHKGVLKHTLGTGHHSMINGITLDKFDKIISVCNGIDREGCFQKF